METKVLQLSYKFHSLKDDAAQRNFHFFLQSKVPFYTQKLLDWHNQLCQILAPKIEHWWFSNGSRLIAWQPTIYQPYYFAEALKEYRALHYFQKISVVDAPSELADYLREIDKGFTYDIDSSRIDHISFKDKLKNFLSPLWQMGQLLISALKNLFLSPKLPQRKNFDFLVYSHFFGLPNLRSDGDHFYGRMFTPLKEKYSLIWVYLNAVKMKTSDKIEARELLKGNEVIFVEDYWSLCDGFQILKKLFKFIFQVRLHETIVDPHLGPVPCRQFAKNFYTQMIKNYYPITEFKIEAFFNKFLAKNEVKKIIYPFEDKGLERAILSSTKEKNILTAGFAHAVHNNGHLYLSKNYKTKFGLAPRPKKVLATGPAAADWIMRRSECGPDYLVPIGTNRYRDPLPYKHFSVQMKILLLIGQGHELTMLANWLDEYPELLKNCDLTVRPYPYAEHEEQNMAKAMIRRHLPVIENGLSLEKQIEECDIAIFCSTSAGLEAILRGRIGIYVNLHHIVPLNPISDKGKDFSNVYSCQTPTELKEVLTRIRGLSVENLNQISQEQIKFAKSIYSPPQLDALIKM